MIYNGNLEFVLYDHFTPHIMESKKKMEEEIHIPHEPPMEDDGAHCDDDVDE